MQRIIVNKISKGGAVASTALPCLRPWVVVPDEPVYILSQFNQECKFDEKEIILIYWNDLVEFILHNRILVLLHIVELIFRLDLKAMYSMFWTVAGS